MKLKLSNLFIVLLIAGSALAQSSATKSADVEYDKQNYFEAKDLYKKAYTKEKDKAIKTKILFKIAMCYREFNDTKMRFNGSIRLLKPNILIQLLSYI